MMIDVNHVFKKGMQKGCSNMGGVGFAKLQGGLKGEVLIFTHGLGGSHNFGPLISLNC